MNIGLIQVEQLIEDAIGDPGKYIVVDSRPEPEFLAGHIPGAIRISWEEWCESAPAEAARILHKPGYWGTLGEPSKQSFERRLIDTGIRQKAPIVVYADSARSKGREGRVAWMLLYFGAREVYMLDGGWSGWINAGRAVEIGVPSTTEKGDFHLALDERRRMMHDQLFNDNADKLPLMIDTRTAAEFHGDCYDYQPVKGRLPNSILFEFESLFEEDGKFVSRERYLEITPPDILRSLNKVSYCEVGVRASTFSLLHEIYTGEIIPVYDGSIMEWGWQLKSKEHRR